MILSNESDPKIYSQRKDRFYFPEVDFAAPPNFDTLPRDREDQEFWQR